MITKEQSGVSHVTALQALECLEDMDDFARMHGIVPTGQYNALKEFINQQREYELVGLYDVGYLYKLKE